MKLRSKRIAFVAGAAAVLGLAVLPLACDDDDNVQRPDAGLRMDAATSDAQPPDAAFFSDALEGDAAADAGQFGSIIAPPGFRVEKLVGGLSFPTALAWDNQNRMYVVESGGGLAPEMLAPARIMRVEGGTATQAVNLSASPVVMNSVVGLTWHDGAFYFTHRHKQDLTGSVSRATLDGQISLVLTGIIDSQSEHQINDIKVGPDGKMYVSVGAAGNAGVIGPSVAPWVMKSPNLKPVPCKDIVLLGKNFETPDFRPGKTGMVKTGAYVPFATETTAGQVIPGSNKCGGSILTFDPANAEATVKPYAHGFRNLLGLAWNRGTGEMFAVQNGYDVRGSRPVTDQYDPTYRVRQNAWYGAPDFSAALEPLTDPKFELPDELQAMVFLADLPQGKNLGFVIDHAASGLTPPDKQLIVGLHQFHSSPSLLDVAPQSWGDLAGNLFVAEWGDLTPPTDPLSMEPAGFQVVRIAPGNTAVQPFVRNAQPGPASKQAEAGQGIERPFDVKFGPDGAMYIVDYGIVTIDMSKKPPYAYTEKSGAIWKVTRPAGL